MEIEKIKQKTSDKVKSDLDNELKRAYDVLKHLKRKVGGNAFNEEYRVVMNDIKGALNLPKKQKNKPREELPKVESDHQDAKVVNIELQKRTDPHEILSLVLPFLAPKDILHASVLCH